MPTYDYVCDACKHAFEKFESMSATPGKVCPKCGKRKLRRLIGTGAGIIFKGSGFYITDYRNDSSYSDAAKKDAEGGSGAMSETKSDAPAPAPIGDKPKGDAPKGDKPKADGPKPEAPKPSAPAPAPKAKSSSAKPSAPKSSGSKGKR